MVYRLLFHFFVKIIKNYTVPKDATLKNNSPTNVYIATAE